MREEPKMPFGKYEGQPISKIESKWYLEWLLKQQINHSRWWTEHIEAVKKKIKDIEYYGR